MGHQLNIRQVGSPIKAKPGATILDAALDASVGYPHGCRSGRCGMCKSRLLEGRVEMGAHTKFALPPEQREQGLILACRAVPLEDCTVSWLGDEVPVNHPVERIACRVEAVEDLTHDIRLVRLASNDGQCMVFSPGQYARVTFPGCPTRDYSMANLPGTPVLEFFVRRVPGGAASTYAAERLAVGDKVTVEGPFGSAYLRESHAGPILAIAGGSGLAPIKAIVEGALSAGMRQPIHVYFGARTERDVYLEPHFDRLAKRHPNLQFIPVLSAAVDVTHRRAGLVTQAVAVDFLSLRGWKVYLAGPPGMVEAATALAGRRDAQPGDIHADAFYTLADTLGIADPPQTGDAVLIQE
ncbi:MAG TPA: 2Fe-2S iron-sulfur cluster-binding protein [Azospirillaceae bacterium]|nr:2Fe-2S iron-sulfur cluster-binding protein [Azospirillaceae bacterium]